MHPLTYRGRLAPSPTGYLHLGHARTFWIAQQRARSNGGTLILRIEDLDRQRCRPEFEQAIVEDLRWSGFDWQEGPFRQSDRLDLYRAAFTKLAASGAIYPCRCSRRDVQTAPGAPHDEEPLYPGTCRPISPLCVENPADDNWRFAVPAGAALEWTDALAGPQQFVAGRDFGDFLVWRRDGSPAYHLAVTVDDAEMGITEVVRGEDLLVSTARQLLLYQALGLQAPSFCHCLLVTDERGNRLAKRRGDHSLHDLRAAGVDPATLPFRN